MKKISTISVRPFLNSKAKPSYIPLLGATKHGPIYFQVTYNRKNTQFRSFHWESYASFDEAKKYAGEYMKEEEELIKSVVAYEVQNSRGVYDLKGLKERYKYYACNVSLFIDNYLRDRIRESVEKSESSFKLLLNANSNYQVPSWVYFEAAEKLIEGFDSFLPENFKTEMMFGKEFITWSRNAGKTPRLIYWLNESIPQDYKLFLSKNGILIAQIEDRLNFLNSTISFEAEKELN